MKIHLTLVALGLATLWGLALASSPREATGQEGSRDPERLIQLSDSTSIKAKYLVGYSNEQPKPTSKPLGEGAALLSLPETLTADLEDGWVEVEATLAGNGEGEIRWMIAPKVKTKVVGSTLLVATTKPGSIVVTAIALVGGKLSPFVSCTISVAGGSSPPAPRPGPIPTPSPAPAPGSSKLFVSVIVDPALATMAEQQLAFGPSLRDKVKAAGHTFNAFAVNDPNLQPPSKDNPRGTGLIAWFRSAGAGAVLVVQDEKGSVLKAIKLPGTEQAILEAIR